MWGALMEYIKTTGDATFATPIVNALTEASFGTVSSFLGAQPTFAETIEGKWNDDILWWALPVVTAGEVFTANAVMPGGVSYFQLANITYQQVFAQWSDVKCGGGLYWSRDRNNAAMKGYKSKLLTANK
jgi:mannan endo-1,6-alpha-mannosidase